MRHATRTDQIYKSGDPADRRVGFTDIMMKHFLTLAVLFAWMFVVGCRPTETDRKNGRWSFLSQFSLIFWFFGDLVNCWSCLYSFKE